jgi:hypothetical protein
MSSSTERAGSTAASEGRPQAERQHRAQRLLTLPPPLAAASSSRQSQLQSQQLPFPAPPGCGAAATAEFDKVAEYYAVIGAHTPELLDAEQHSQAALRFSWGDSITDIAVLRAGKGDSCPPGYELIEATPGEHKADLNHGSLHRSVYLAVCRQRVSKR